MPAKLLPFRHFRIGRSRAGLGLFARVAIRKGQFILRYSGRKIRTDAADDLDTRYLFEINARWTIDVIKIRAIKNIKAGDEITYHYGRNYFEAFIKPVGCKCRACANKKVKMRSRRSSRR
jgi:uncharacterized protein